MTSANNYLMFPRDALPWTDIAQLMGEAPK